jgi:hypothetical protein
MALLLLLWACRAVPRWQQRPRLLVHPKLLLLPLLLLRELPLLLCCCRQLHGHVIVWPAVPANVLNVKQAAVPVDL